MNKSRFFLIFSSLVLLGFSTACKNSGRGISDLGSIIKKLDTIQFDFDRYNIRADAQSTLERNSEWLRNNSNGTLVIEGHTDEQGTNEYNLALGEKRALAAKSYYINLGIPSSRISTISYGEERPVDPSHHEGAWSINRRAESLVKK